MPVINQKMVQALEPVDRESCLWDDFLKGFFIRMRPDAAPTFWVRYSVNGRRRKTLIGPCHVIKAEAAREKARQILEMAFLGRDFLNEKKQLVDAPTLLELRDLSLEISARKNTPDHVRMKRTHWDRYILPILGKNKKVKDVVRADIDRLFRSVPGKVAPNHVVKTFSKALNDSEIQDPPWRPQRSNPCYNFQFHKVKSRDVTLSRDELDRLLSLLRSEMKNPTLSTNYHFLIFLLLITGLRFSEWRDRSWDDVNLERKTLFIKKTKAGDSRTVYLSDDAIEVVKMIPRRSKWIFSNESKTGPIHNKKKVWNEYKRLAKFDCRIHDLRHTAASFTMLEGGANLKEVSALLGHKSVGMTERYLNVHDERLRDISQKASRAVLGTISTQ